MSGRFFSLKQLEHAILETQNWHILVVDDEFDSVQLVSKILRHHGIDVHVAHDGYECMEMLKTLHPTLVLMDLALPKMDGWETLAKMRLDVTTAKIPVVAMTAYHSVNVEEDAHNAGFDGYFPKPLDTSLIIEQLAKVIQQA